MDEADVRTLPRHQDAHGSANTAITTRDQDSFSLHESTALILDKCRLSLIVPDFELSEHGGRVELAVEARTTFLVLWLQLSPWKSGDGFIGGPDHDAEAGVRVGVTFEGYRNTGKR